MHASRTRSCLQIKPRIPPFAQFMVRLYLSRAAVGRGGERMQGEGGEKKAPTYNWLCSQACGECTSSRSAPRRCQHLSPTAPKTHTPVVNLRRQQSFSMNIHKINMSIFPPRPPASLLPSKRPRFQPLGNNHIPGYVMLLYRAALIHTIFLVIAWICLGRSGGWRTTSSAQL